MAYCFIKDDCSIRIYRSVIGASLSEPHTNNKFVRWFVRGKTAAKSGLLTHYCKFGRVVQAL